LPYPGSISGNEGNSLLTLPSHEDLDKKGYVEVSGLNLPAALIDDVDSWDQQFQATFCDDYPLDSGFDNVEKMKRHNVRGVSLRR